MYNVRGSVGCGKRHRDDKVRGSETEQDQDKQLPCPQREKILQHCDTALTVRTRLSHASINWKSSRKVITGRLRVLYCHCGSCLHLPWEGLNQLAPKPVI